MRTLLATIGGMVARPFATLVQEDQPAECNASCWAEGQAGNKAGQKVSPIETSGVNLALVMGYQFDPLVHRMVDKYNWTEIDARQAFEDTKRFLYLCGVGTNGPMAPTEKIDEVWHNFILFTEDYHKFCKTHFGRFIHHRPRRRDDKPSKGSPIKNTLRAAFTAFGDMVLGENWVFTRADGRKITLRDCQREGDADFGDASCKDKCIDCKDAAEAVECKGSTNCQDSDCHDTK